MTLAAVDTDTVLVDLLRELLDGQRRILAALETRQQTARAALTRGDRAILGKLLPVLAATFGSESFSSRDVVEDEAPGLCLVRGRLSAKALGKLFARAVDVAIDGLLIRRAGTECHSTVWQVVAGGGLETVSIPCTVAAPRVQWASGDSDA